MPRFRSDTSRFKTIAKHTSRSFYFAALPTICLLVYWALGETGLIIFA